MFWLLTKWGWTAWCCNPLFSKISWLASAKWRRQKLLRSQSTIFCCWRSWRAALVSPTSLLLKKQDQWHWEHGGSSSTEASVANSLPSTLTWRLKASPGGGERIHFFLRKNDSDFWNVVRLRNGSDQWPPLRPLLLWASVLLLSCLFDLLGLHKTTQQINRIKHI